MRLVLTLVARDFDALQEALPPALEAVAGAGAPVRDTHVLGEGAVDLYTDGADPIGLRAHAARAFERQAVDFCVQPAEGRRKRLLVADMDSTIIGCECLDELADFAGLKAEVAAITERAMGGEIAFEGALRERVGMLAGLDLAMLDRVYDERVRLNPGARTLVRTMAANGARCVLVSGGFQFFTARVAEAAGFHAHRGQQADRRRRAADRPGRRADPRPRGQARRADRGGRRPWASASPRPSPSATAPTTWR